MPQVTKDERRGWSKGSELRASDTWSKDDVSGGHNQSQPWLNRVYTGAAVAASETVQEWLPTTVACFHKDSTTADPRKHKSFQHHQLEIFQVTFNETIAHGSSPCPTMKSSHYLIYKGFVAWELIITVAQPSSGFAHVATRNNCSKLSILRRVVGAAEGKLR